MKIDHQHAKCILNSARPQSVDAIVLAKSVSQKDKEDMIQSTIKSLKTKANSKECVVIVIET